ncbi:MAG: Ig-like domain-containing protein [Myxococcota bacterium]
MSAAVLTTVVMVAGCKEGSPPVLTDPGDQIAVVGQTFTLNLIASDPDGGGLNFSVRSSIAGIDAHAVVTRTPDGQGLFTYTPVSGHEGEHIFDFVVSDGDFNTVLPINLEVRGASGIDSAPIFREPQAGLVIEADDACSDIKALQVLVEDLDTVDIELTQAPPILDGAELTVDPSSGGKEAVWKWCPSRDDQQIFQHQLTLSADDGENPPTLKQVPIVIRPGTGADCPGGSPSITHDPEDVASLQDVAIVADFSDDVGISAPVVYYSLEDPTVGGEIDFSQLAVANMTLDSGNAAAGTWRALIPNPVVEGAEGDTATVYYVIEAVDTDDPEGGCNHRSNSPSDGVHQVVVTHPGEGRGGAGLCEPCSFDIQCGDENDLCIQLSDGTVCASDCDAGCPDGYECSENPITSIDGAAAQQCTPIGGQCGGGNTECEGDQYDPADDTPEGSFDDQGAYTNGFSDSGVLCPGDVDWLAFDLTESTSLSVTLNGDFPPDMDIVLMNEDLNTVAAQTASDSSMGTVSDGCLAPGRYYTRVNSYPVDGETVKGTYEISIEFDTASCAVAPCCEVTEGAGCDDDLEIQQCVCDFDPLCCDDNVGWDQTCVNVANDECMANCPVEV